jgi:UDP-N-acetylglucosamine 2-epimerase (non-hydrolysing)
MGLLIMGHRIAFIFGTRPEAIKLCPVINRLAGHPTLTPRVCVTAQHREMLDQVLDIFAVAADFDLDLMRPDQTLPELTALAVRGVSRYLAAEKPDMVLVQGDTTTAFCAALAAFYERIPVGHVEAGLRTWRRYAPFPEEINRVLVSRLADLHFAPTAWSRDNLVKEGIDPDTITVTGNTVIDAIFSVIEKVRAAPPPMDDPLRTALDAGRFATRVLITGHRRENFGEGFRNICTALKRLAERFPRTAFIYPVHLNPNVQQPVRAILGGCSNIFLLPPQDYRQFVYLMDSAQLIITDSGGIQEEAPSLGKPVLVMREATERPEAVAAGTVRMVGTSVAAIVSHAERLLSDDAYYRTMSRASDVYGDGAAAGRIIAAIAAYFS